MAGLYKSLKVEITAVKVPTAIPRRDRWGFRTPELEKTSLAPDELSGHALHKQMMEAVCYPAMEEVAQELRCAARTWS